MVRNLRNPFKAGSQNYRLFERLRIGPATNIEIVRDMHILNSTGRISDIRKHVPVTSQPIGRGVWRFSLAC